LRSRAGPHEAFSTIRARAAKRKADATLVALLLKVSDIDHGARWSSSSDENSAVRE
jgi:hypothetical protein